MNAKPIVIGVAGATGAGKTTVVQAIVDRLNNQDVIIIQHDSYYKDRSHLSLIEREGINYDHPDALETQLLIKHIKKFTSGLKVEIPIYDFATHTRKKEEETVGPAKAVIVEGIFIFSTHTLRNLMDIKIFVDTSDDIRFIRRLQRDTKERGRSIGSVINQYMETVRPMHIEFVEPSRKYADIIIPEGHNHMVTDMVVSIIKDKILR